MAAPWPRVRFRQPNYVRDLPPLPFEEPLGPPGSSLVCGPRRGDLPSAMIVHPDIVGSVPRSAIPIVMAATYEGWARVGKTFHPSPPLCPGIHATALVAQGAEVESSAVRRAGGRPQMSTMRFDDRSRSKVPRANRLHQQRERTHHGIDALEAFQSAGPGRHCTRSGLLAVGWSPPFDSEGDVLIYERRYRAE